METPTRKLDSEGMLGLAAALLAVALLAPARAGAQPSFNALGVASGTSSCQVGIQGISGDGTAIVGLCDGRAFRWTAATGITPLISPFPSNPLITAEGVSFDGSIVVGSTGGLAPDSVQAGYRWVSGSLGFMVSPFRRCSDFFRVLDADGVSNDGQVVVGGHSADGCKNQSFRWTPTTGVVALGLVPDCNWNQAHSVSDDGSVVVGVAAACSSFVFNDQTMAVRWTPTTGFQSLGFLMPPEVPVAHARSNAVAVSPDGRVIVGGSGPASGFSSGRAFMWTEESGMVNLGIPAGISPTGQFHAFDLAAEGCTVVGNGPNIGVIWDPVHGMRVLADVLTGDFGRDLTGYSIVSAHGISDDGTVIAGTVQNHSLGRQEPFRAVIENPACAVNAAPTANAGLDQTVDEGTLVTLDGSASGDPDGDALTFSWQQIAGTAVTLSDASAAQPTFTAPYLSDNETLSFQLIVGDGEDSSEPDTVDITVVNVNNPPVADAGDDATIKEGAVATLDAGNSFDPDGDTLSYLWTQVSGPPVVLDDPTSPTPSFTAPLGVGAQLVFQLVVDDGGQEPGAPDTVTLTVVENSAPVADAGADQTRDEGALVTLDGSSSADPDGGDTLSYQWTQVSGPMVVLDDPTSPTPSFTAPDVGAGGEDVVFELVVTDDDSVNPRSSTADRVTVNVRNVNDPPSCDAARALCEESKIESDEGCLLWPPNHKLLSIAIGGVMDPNGSEGLTIEISGVTQDEPVLGTGSGDTSPDAVVQDGAEVDALLLRAEREGGSNGRVYVVSFTAGDGTGSCTGSVTVGVPHDRKDTPIDDGQLFDSTLP